MRACFVIMLMTLLGANSWGQATTLERAEKAMTTCFIEGDESISYPKDIDGVKVRVSNNGTYLLDSDSFKFVSKEQEESLEGELALEQFSSDFITSLSTLIKAVTNMEPEDFLNANPNHRTQLNELCGGISASLDLLILGTN